MRDKTIQIRVDENEKKQFETACRKREEVPSDVLRQAMQNYVQDSQEPTRANQR